MKMLRVYKVGVQRFVCAADPSRVFVAIDTEPSELSGIAATHLVVDDKGFAGMICEPSVPAEIQADVYDARDRKAELEFNGVAYVLHKGRLARLVKAGLSAGNVNITRTARGYKLKGNCTVCGIPMETTLKGMALTLETLRGVTIECGSCGTQNKVA